MTTTTATDLVLAELRGAVLVLTLNRPERLNTWTDALEERYYERLDEAENDPEVRAIVVTGAGRGFCAGADMDDLERGATVDGAADGSLRDRPRARTFPLTVRKPLIAAINGAAAGLGLVEALYCDIRFATPQAKLTTAFARRGLVAEYGLAWLLPAADRDQPRAGPPAVRPHRARRGGAPARAGRPPQRARRRSSTTPWPTRPTSPTTARPGRWRRSRPRSRRTSTAASRRPSRPPTSSCSRRSTSRTSRRACAATSSAARRRSPDSSPGRRGHELRAHRAWEGLRRARHRVHGRVHLPGRGRLRRRRCARPATRTSIPPIIEELKAEARARGLWNLFHPHRPESGPRADERSSTRRWPRSWAARRIAAGGDATARAPDTGNMEVLTLFGTAEQQERWLRPLLDGEIRSAFAMTEPDVASSDATNIETADRARRRRLRHQRPQVVDLGRAAPATARS